MTVNEDRAGVGCTRCGHVPSWHRVSRQRPNPCTYPSCTCPDYVVPREPVNEDPLVRAPRAEEVWAAAVVRHDEVCFRGPRCRHRTWHIQSDYWAREKARAIREAHAALDAARDLMMP